MPLHLYTPAQVTVAPHTEDHVHVVGGEVWDFSRFALATPVIVVGQAKGGMTGKSCGCFEIEFDSGSAELSTAMRWKLLEVPKGRHVSVAAGPSPLAQMRAQEVSAFLAAHGRKSDLRRLYRAGDADAVFVLTDDR